MWRQAHPGCARRRRLTLLVVLAALVAVPAGATAGLGDLVAKDTVRNADSLVAVATGTVNDPGKLTLTITTKPRNKKVQWGYTSRCFKDGIPSLYPPGGEYEDTISRSPIRRTIQTAVEDPDSCVLAVSAKLDYKSGKKVTAKIFNK